MGEGAYLPPHDPTCARPLYFHLMALYEDAHELAKVMLNAGREPSFVLRVLSGYYGAVGVEAALAVLSLDAINGKQGYN